MLTHAQEEFLTALTDVINGNATIESLDPYTTALKPIADENPKIFADAEGNTPLHIACLHRNFQLVQYLTAHGFIDNLEQLNKDGYSPLHIVCNKRTKAVMDVTTRTSSTHAEGMNCDVRPLLIASTNQPDDRYDRELIIFLLANSKGEPVPDKGQGNNALHFILENYFDDFEMIKAFFVSISAEAGHKYLQQSNNLGQTPLHIACCLTPFTTIRYLLELTLNQEHHNCYDSTAMNQSANSDARANTSTKWLVGAYAGSALAAGGFAAATVVASIFFPPTIALLPFSIWAGVAGAIPVGYSDVLGMKDLKMMHFIAEKNTADVLRAFCQYIPAHLLSSFVETDVAGGYSIRALIAARGKVKGADYEMTLAQFNQLFNQETCFYACYDYFINKKRENASKANFDARMDDFCHIVTMLTTFFAENTTTMPSHDELATHIATYQQSDEGQRAAQKIMQTKHGFLGTGFGGEDRYLSQYRNRLLTADIEQVRRRLDDLCKWVYMDHKTRLAKKATDNRAVNAIHITIDQKIMDAFTAGGVNYEEMFPEKSKQLQSLEKQLQELSEQFATLATDNTQTTADCDRAQMLADRLRACLVDEQPSAQAMPSSTSTYQQGSTPPRN